MPEQWTKEEKSWIFSEAGSGALNSIWGIFLPFFYLDVYSCTEMTSTFTAPWALAVGLSLLFFALFAPTAQCGADSAARKKKALMFWGVAQGLVFVCVAILCASTFYESTALAERSLLALLLAAGVGLSSLRFYDLFSDSLLSAVTLPERVDRLNTAGYCAAGISSALIPLILFLIFKLPGDVAKRLALLFALAALVRIITLLGMGTLSLANDGVLDPSIRLKNIPAGLRRLHKRRALLPFLAVCLCITAGLRSVFLLGFAYGADCVAHPEKLVLILLLCQFVKLPCTLLVLVIARRTGRFRVLQILIGLLTVLCLSAILMSKLWQFAVIAVLFCAVQGSMRALLREVFGILAAGPDRRDEAFLLYDHLCAVAAAIGVLSAAFSAVFLGTRAAACFIALWFVAGVIGMFFFLPRRLAKGALQM